MNLPRLDDATVRAYLERLGTPEVSLDLAGLTRLRKAHLHALPFHNLVPLANEGGAPGPFSIEAAVEGNIAGLGGTCDQLTPPFVALLRALGFEASLVDPCVGSVHLPQGCFVVDVGFSPGVEPSLTSLQAVRRTEWTLATLHDDLYQRVAGGLTTSRPIASWNALAELLHATFGLPEALIGRALHALRRRVPNLLARAARPRPPVRFLLSMAVTRRTEGIAGLLRSATEALRLESRSADTVGVLVLDNGGGDGDALGAVLEDARHQGLRVTRLNAWEQLGRLATFQRSGLLPQALSVPLPIGAARTLQVSLLHDHLRTGTFDLPHPGDGGGPVVVWMLDDDLSFRRLRETSEGLEVEPGRDLFTRAEALWTDHPEVSVVLGTFSGEPPIPGYATLHVQVRDLAGNVQAMAALSPDAPWRPGEAPRHLPDYYYDHARGSTAHLQAVFPWVPPERAPWSVREAFRTLCAAFTQVPHGRQVTRPLTHRASDTLAPSRNRGGNALFLDLDALVAAPYPVLRGEDGLMTRRADTLWAHLLAREPLSRLVQADLDLMHGRRVGDGSSPLVEPQPDPTALRGFVEGQERGVVLARLLERGAPVGTSEAEHEISVRRALLARGREGVRQGLAEARGVLTRPEAWWWREEEMAASARACLAALEQVERLARGVEALDSPALPEQLAGFARHVVENLSSWRATWA